MEEQDTRVELTEERVREIAREEARKAIGEVGDVILGIQMGEAEARRILQGKTEMTPHVVQP